MPLGGGQVDQAPLAEHVDPPAVLQRELVHERPDGPPAARHRAERRQVDLDVEVAGVRQDRAVLQPAEVVARQDRGVAGDGDEDVAHLRRPGHRHHLEAVHDRLERAQGLDLGDDDVGAHALRPGGDAAAAHPVAGDDERASGQQDVRRAQDAVDRGLPRAVPVVEEVLGVGVVDRDHRKRQHALLLHRTKPDDTRRRLLRAADDVAEQILARPVELRDQVRAVVHRDLRSSRQDRLDVAVVAVAVLALVGEDGDLVAVHEGRRRVVLGRERVRGAEGELGPAGLERQHQHRGLGRHVQARAEADALERLLLGEALADLAEDGHELLGPLDLEPARRREREVLHVVHDHHRPSTRRRRRADL